LHPDRDGAGPRDPPPNLLRRSLFVLVRRVNPVEFDAQPQLRLSIAIF
jgi:hypothetical protein